MDTHNPSTYILKRFDVGHVKSNDDSVCLTIELISEISESVLPGSVPELDCNFCIVLGFVLGRDEVDTDCSDMRRLELALVESF